MKKFIRLFSLCLAAVLVLSSFGCTGKSPSPEKETHPALAAADLKIGVLFSDDASINGQSYFQKIGIENAMQKLSLKEEQVLYKTNIADVSFEAEGKLTTTTAPTETTTEKEETEKKTTAKSTEPESFTDDEGNNVIVATPVTPVPAETAVEAVFDLLEKGCNVLIATDAVYDDFTAWVAGQYKDLLVLQYNGTHTDLANVQPYSVKLYEGFYMAGAVAGALGAKNIGFVAGVKDDAAVQNINAFALGCAKYNKDAKLTVRYTNVPFDLSLERTIPETLIEKDKCDLIAQSVLTALPQAVASNQDGEYKFEPVACIGFGYDMAADGGKQSVCSVMFDFGVYFEKALSALTDGTFEATTYVGGVTDGVVTLSKLYTDSAKAAEAQKAVADAFAKGLDVFEGVTAAKGEYAANVTVK